MCLVCNKDLHDVNKILSLISYRHYRYSIPDIYMVIIAWGMIPCIIKGTNQHCYANRLRNCCLLLISYSK